MVAYIWIFMSLAAISAAETDFATGALSENSRRELMLRRQLQATCPILYCSTAKESFCSRRTSDKPKCSKCMPPRVPSTSGTACVCPVGSYPTSQDGACARCPLGYYCPRGSMPFKSTAVRCPQNMVTAAVGAKSLMDCLNAPGFRYERPDSRTVRAVACGDNTWSPGLDKSTSCQKCSNGLKTDPDAGAGTYTSIAACTAPPGFYRSGDFPLPCAQGTFKEGYNDDDSCQSCADLFSGLTPDSKANGDLSLTGITTPGMAATSARDCLYTLPGYMLVDEAGAGVVDILDPTSPRKMGGARFCPNNWVCPGGSPYDSSGIPRRCPDGLFTLKPGAKTDQACVAPPGMYWPGPGQKVRPCPSGTFKDTWELIGIEGCLPCGTGPWMSDPLTYVDEYDPITGKKSFTVMVRGSPHGCYLQPGMGSVAIGLASPGDGANSGTGEYNGGDDYYGGSEELPKLQALFCPAGFYGVANKTRGLYVMPCASCPVNMWTFMDELANVEGSQSTRAEVYLALQPSDGSEVQLPVPAGVGFMSPEACLTNPGYGYIGGIARICEPGTYNTGRNRSPCTRCPPGFTTDGPGKASVEACSVPDTSAGDDNNNG